MNKLPRSLRNNNPFNIKKSSSRWLGKVKGTDKVFETFDNLEHGTRAGIKLLLNYLKQGYNTPRKIISRFAPSSENDSESYLRFVCDHLLISPDEVIDNPVYFFNLCEGIILFESGLSFSQLYDFGIRYRYLSNIFTKYNFNF